MVAFVDAAAAAIGCRRHVAVVVVADASIVVGNKAIIMDQIVASTFIKGTTLELLHIFGIVVQFGFVLNMRQ